MKIKRVVLSATVLAVLAMSPGVQAKPFKWASQGEISTWDIHSQNNALQNGLHANVYESLVYYNSKTFQVDPMLAPPNSCSTLPLAGVSGEMALGIRTRRSIG